MPLLGNLGKVARARLRYDQIEHEEPPKQDGWKPALPTSCLRRLSSPRPAECDPVQCEGAQRDGGCLCDIVLAAQQQGVEWMFAIDPEGYWQYVGPPLL